MTSLAYLLNPRRSDAGVMTGSGVIDTSASVSNVQNPRPRLRAIFSSGTCHLECDMGASYPISGFFMGFINSLSSADTFRFRCKNTYPVTSSPVYDSTTLTIWPTGSDLSAYGEIHRQYEFPVQTVRYWRVDFSCSVPVQIGRCFAGLRVEPVYGVSAFTPSASEPIIATIDLEGEETRRPAGGARRTIRLEWPALEKPEALGPIYEHLLERGMSRDYAVALTAGSSEIISPLAYVYLGTGELKISHNTFTHFFSAGLDLVEMATLRMR